jgi:hypothetical protein
LLLLVSASSSRFTWEEVVVGRVLHARILSP